MGKKFCTTCGKELNEGAKFCTGCGKKIEDPAQPAEPAYQPEQSASAPEQFSYTAPEQVPPKKSGKNVGVIIGAVCAAVVVLAAVLGIVLNSVLYTSLDLEQAISIEISGVNGSATAEAEINEEYIISLLAENEKNTDALIGFELDAEYALIITPEENISNGDEITCSLNDTYVKGLKKSGIKVKNSTFTVTAADLPEVKEIDPFNGLKLVYNGVSGSGKIEFDTSACDADTAEVIDNYLNMRIDGSRYNLKNGDTITVTVGYYNEYELLENGYKLTATEKKFTLDGFGEYITDTANVSFSAVEKEMTEKLIENLEDIYNVKLDASAIVTEKKYLLVKTSESSVNAYDCIYHVKGSSLGLDNDNPYFFELITPGIIKMPDGTVKRDDSYMISFEALNFDADDIDIFRNHQQELIDYLSKDGTKVFVVQ